MSSQKHPYKHLHHDGSFCSIAKAETVRFKPFWENRRHRDTQVSSNRPRVGVDRRDQPWAVGEAWMSHTCTCLLPSSMPGVSFALLIFYSLPISYSFIPHSLPSPSSLVYTVTIHFWYTVTTYLRGCKTVVNRKWRWAHHPRNICMIAKVA